MTRKTAEPQDSKTAEIQRAEPIEVQKYQTNDGTQAVCDFACSVLGASNSTSKTAIQGNSDVSKAAMDSFQKRVDQINQELKNPDLDQNVAMELRNERALLITKIEAVANNAMDANCRIHRNDTVGKTVVISVALVGACGLRLYSKLT